MYADVEAYLAAAIWTSDDREEVVGPNGYITVGGDLHGDAADSLQDMAASFGEVYVQVHRGRLYFEAG